MAIYSHLSFHWEAHHHYHQYWMCSYTRLFLELLLTLTRLQNDTRLLISTRCLPIRLLLITSQQQETQNSKLVHGSSSTTLRSRDRWISSCCIDDVTYIVLYLWHII